MSGYSDATLFVSQIFWPESLLHSQNHSYLIGWNDTNFRCCIVGTVSSKDISLDLLQTILQSKDLYNISHGCSINTGPPTILGEYVPFITNSFSAESNSQTAGIWLILTKETANSAAHSTPNSTSEGRIKLHSLHSCGYLYRTSCYMFRYISHPTLTTSVS
eukprot:gene9640-20035_t